MSDVPTPAAGVPVFDESGALLLGRHTHDGRWATFGGRVEAGEDTHSAARRELAEEAGIQLETAELLGEFGGSEIYTVTYGDGSSETYDVTMFCAIIEPNTPLRVQGEEVVEARWFPPAKIVTVDLATDMVEIVPAAVRWFQRRRKAENDTESLS